MTLQEFIHHMEVSLLAQGIPSEEVEAYKKSAQDFETCPIGRTIEIAKMTNQPVTDLIDNYCASYAHLSLRDYREIRKHEAKLAANTQSQY